MNNPPVSNILNWSPIYDILSKLDIITGGLSLGEQSNDKVAVVISSTFLFNTAKT